MKSVLIISLILLLAGCSGKDSNVLMIAEQGSFAVGGTVLKDSLGHTFHGDHAYVFYQKPVDARKYPLVFGHGVGQFSKTWMDGKASKTSSCAKDSLFISLTNREGAMPDEARKPQLFLLPLTKNCGLTASAWAFGRIISKACSSAVTRRRSTSISAK